jgi:hypothetical protein
MSFTTPPPFQGPETAPQHDHARQWGIASIILGLLLPFAVPAGGIVASGAFAAYAMLGGRTGRADERGLLTVLTILPLLLLSISGCGIWFGIRGMQWAERQRSPGAYAAAGIVINAVCALVLIIAAAVVLVISGNRFG